MSNPVVFLDMTRHGGSPVGRIEIELFDQGRPKTAEKLRLLCTTALAERRSVLPYRKSLFDRVISRFKYREGQYYVCSKTKILEKRFGAKIRSFAPSRKPVTVEFGKVVDGFEIVTEIKKALKDKIAVEICASGQIC